MAGSSIISRALGTDLKEKTLKTFGNQITFTMPTTVSMVILGLIFVHGQIPAFGGKDAIFSLANDHYIRVLYGVPFLALTMIGNSVIRSKGNAKYAMIAMIIPSIGNLLMEYSFIYILDWAIIGDAWSTRGACLLSFSYILYFFPPKKSELNINIGHLGLDTKILKERSVLGAITKVRQAMISVVPLLVNKIGFTLGGGSTRTF